MSLRAFDLNIEEVLENWEVEHALREVIANALDEQLLSKTAEVQITKDKDGTWRIRDFGRGLQIEHFTLKENPEKLSALSGVIGKFGVGLKDALATFHRRGIRVVIRSHHGTYRLAEEAKHGFDKIRTLHVEYDDTPIDMRGTEFVLDGVKDETVAKAKALFLRFAGEETIETTSYGQILRRRGGAARVYILGVLASEEPNFLFSYNIGSLTEAMKKRLNRERLNVGRTTYAERVKAILKSAKSEIVADLLIEQIERRAVAEQRDEMTWIEISQMALTLMNQRKKVVYFTEQQLQANPNFVDSAKRDGLAVVIIREQQKEKLAAQALAGGPEVRTLDTYVTEYNSSFQYQFVPPDRLTREERGTSSLAPLLLSARN